ncbi:ectonucleotide pyrophosphatase/phosphodiesterase family member 3-like isoform X2 [Ptychodera flava]|uniref:ectonucleotide pyrophosphatase/phosphodiesterase family member 3-like isoform X2 n=1 Tax=Ptychodera flava TaxID=63121 RepID=UPI00396A1D8C
MKEMSDGDCHLEKKNPWVTVAVVCIVAACGLGIGIGIGYVIGNEGETVAEPLPEPQPGPPPKWLDLPCETNPEPVCPEGYSRPPMLLMSLDGFRAEYLLRNLTPNIQKLAKCGVHAPYMLPVFPTYTFPNHYSIVTGMYPEAHGIVANSMYDPEMRKSFSLSSDEKLNPEWWEDGIPIWETAERNGMKTGAFFWPGTDVKIHGIYPSYWNLYAGGVSYEQRIVTLLSWMALPNEDLRPKFMTTYFDEPDTAGHDYGPVAPEMDAMLAEMDELVGLLMDGIVQMNLTNCFDLIIVADHGMAPTSCNRTFFIHDYINSDDYFIRAGAIARLDPKSSAAISDPDDIVEAFQCKEENMTGYTKWDLPKNWHYADSVRIEDSVVISDEEYYVSIKNDESYNPSWCSGGNHGWDHRGIQMESLFLAHGPSFKQNLKIDPFLCIELYPLMAEILGLPEAPNNATTGSLSHILKNPKPIPEPDFSGATDPDDCPFPSSDTEYNYRTGQDESGCTCESEPDLKEHDDRLDLSQSEKDASHDKHLPFGAPVVNFATSHCVLTQDNYVTGYDNRLRLPLWASYTVDKRESRQAVPVVEDCVRADVRVSPEDTPACTDYNLTSKHDMGFNVHPGIWDTQEGQMDTLITTNMFPMNPNFTTELWDYMADNILGWADKYNGVNVISGALFDYNYDGHRDSDDDLADHESQAKFGDTWIPSHYYVIVTRCPGDQAYGSSCTDDLEVLPFILRDSSGIEICQTQERYLQLNIATVRDIEILSGLSFFPELPIAKSIQLKLFVNQHVWPST